MASTHDHAATMKWLTVMILTLSGCVGSIRWSDIPTAKITLETPPNYLYSNEWRDKVLGTFRSWENVLPEGCKPFELEIDAKHTIKLVTYEDWSHGKHTGIANENDIEIRSDGPVRLVLLHELGHVMGLEHTNEYSIMRQGDDLPREPTVEDGKHAAESIGCD